MRNILFIFIISYATYLIAIQRKIASDNIDTELKKFIIAEKIIRPFVKEKSNISFVSDSMSNEIRFRAQFAFSPLILDTLNIGDTILILRHKSNLPFKTNYPNYTIVVDTSIENIEIKLLAK